MDVDLNVLESVASPYILKFGRDGVAHISPALIEKLGCSEDQARSFLIDQFAAVGSSNAGVISSPCGSAVLSYVKVVDVDTELIFFSEKQAQAMPADQTMHMLLEIARSTSDLILIIKDGMVVFSNDQISKITGHQVEAVVGEQFLQLVSAESRAAFIDACQLAFREAQWPITDLMLTGQAGRRIDVRINGGWASEGDSRLLWLFIRDITEDKRNLRLLREADRKFMEIYDESPIGILYVTPRGRVVDCNRFVGQLTGFSQSEIKGAPFTNFAVDGEVEHLVADFEKLYRGDQPIHERESRLRTKGGQEITISYNAQVIYRKGHKAGALMLISDVTEKRALARQLLEKNAQMEKMLWEMAEVNDALEARSGELNQAHEELKLLNERLELLSITDGLTGIYNHRHFQDRLSAEIDRHERIEGDVLSLAILDIDDFKQFNDTYGHQAGDQVLRELAVTLRETVRSIDVIARYGGEEFAVIFPDSELKEALVVAERICESVRNRSITFDDGTTVSITVSIGLGMLGPDESDKRELIRRADSALYVAKAQWKDCVEIWEPEVEQG